MDGARQLSLRWLTRTVRKPSFWLILVFLVLITLPHYEETLKHPAFLTHLTANIGLERHAFERTLYLAPIVWAGFLFGWRGGFVTSLVALACMLPRAIFISPYPKDALFETSVVFIIANVIAIGFASLRREREYRTQLEVTHQELQKSEQRYRELFENAHEAIWLHDLQDNIFAANKSLARLTGYTLEELSGVKSSDLFTEGCIDSIKEAEDLPSRDEGHLSEATLVRKDKSEASVQLSTNPVLTNGQIVAFQHIARDVTEQKRMQENVRFYAQQAIRAQEEERKRISREIHDEAIQALVVHARRLDTLASNVKGLPEEDRRLLEELWREANDVMQRLRRLGQDLRPPILERLGLLPALEWLASDMAEYSGIATNVNVVGNERRLPEEIELALFRITQEALRNVWRHSEATQAEVVVEFDEGKTKITVGDNGKGFSLPKMMGDLARDGRLGLAGMQERVQLIGGALRVQSQPGKGTSITVEVPA